MTAIRSLAKLFVNAPCILIVLLGIALLPTHSVAAASVTSCIQPPKNIDHATFTDTQLDLYGLPRRQPSESLAHWQQLVRDAKVRVCMGKPVSLPHHTNVPKKQPPPATYDEESNIWGGNIANDYGYTEVVGQWNVPCLILLGHDGWTYVWTGLGGDGSDGGGNLVQGGSASHEYLNSSGHYQAEYFAWIEDYPNDPNAVKAYKVTCGDTMYTAMWQDYSNGNPVKAHMYVTDRNSGQYWSAYNTSAFSNGSSAEWIVERPGTDLSNFDWVSFTQCYAIRYGSAASPINLSHNLSTMINNGRTLASIGPLYPDSSDIGANFEVVWHATI